MADIKNIMADSGRFSLPTNCSSEFNDKDLLDFGVKSPKFGSLEYSEIRIPKNYKSLFTCPDEIVVEGVNRLMERLPSVLSELQESVENVCVKDYCSIQNKKIFVLGPGQSTLVRKRTQQLIVK